MKTLYASQPVKYVNADGGISDATLEQVDGLTARVRVAENHVALAAYNADAKTPNTFHLADEEAATTAEGQESKAFAPGGAPEPTN